MLSLPLDEEALRDLLEPVMPGLLKLLLSKEILKARARTWNCVP